ncbi:MAG: LysM peptidoglycan-binding domain-containing protein [Fulvivirga sp.]|uniref:lytic transglycosylase domain-containing protein n=1 Tax=Fulvivirga sp. TaxID=1931237 RepID=UPI0032EAF548
MFIKATIFCFILVFCSVFTTAQNSNTNEPNDTYLYEFIPGEADYDLIKDRLKCIEKTIPLEYNTRVHAFVNYFTVKDRNYTRGIIKKKDVYFPLFEKYLAKYGLPDELKYLSIIESGLNPEATSVASAVGLWQFMSATGRYFGLHNDWYIDERMDPEKSTEAACQYLKQLYGMFGDWELAIAAYNSGPGNIRKAIRRSGYKRTFWEIYPHLLRETRSYLPQFTAMIYTLNYTEEHNFTVDDLEYYQETDTIMVSGYAHLTTIAAQLNLCENEMIDLNPSLRRGVVPEGTKLYAINIPAHEKERFYLMRKDILDSASKVGKSQIEYLSRNTPGSTYGRDKIVYKVRSGDVLGRIAERYNVRVSDLRTWNNIHGNLIRVGQNLTIWQKPGYVARRTEPAFDKLPDGTKTYIVQPGDTLWDISRKFNGLSIERLKSLNELSSNTIKAGQKLIIGS